MTVLRYNPWNQDAEPGDIMVGGGRAWRLYERKGGPRSASGELSMRELKKKGKRATIENGELVWIESSRQAGR